MTRFERGFVWAGGALFVASLAACAYTFLATWGVGTPGLGWRAVPVDVLLFLLFALHHSVFARQSIKRAMGRVLPDRLLRSFYVWTASLLLLLVLALWQPVGGELFRTTGWLSGLHAVLQLAGLGLIARAVSAISVLELAGVQPARVEEPLCDRGPYALVRHPVYLGWLLVVFGAAAMTGDRLLFAVISSAYICLAVPMEERSLISLFGDEYRRYQRRVRWRLVPYVY